MGSSVSRSDSKLFHLFGIDHKMLAYAESNMIESLQPHWESELLVKQARWFVWYQLTSPLIRLTQPLTLFD